MKQKHILTELQSKPERTRGTLQTIAWELPDVELEDKRAEEWCRDATKLTGRA